MSFASTFQRAPQIVWRLAHDRVMIHRIVGTPADTAVDLLGPVGLVWLALDEPATRDELTQRLYDAEVIVEDIDTELDRLLAAGLIVELGGRDSPYVPDPDLIDVGVIAVLDMASTCLVLRAVGLRTPTWTCQPGGRSST